MRAERLESMPTSSISFDLETALIQPGLDAPPPVLGSAAELGPDGKIRGALLDKEQAAALFRQILDNPSIVITGANLPFDFLVMAVYHAGKGIDLAPQIFDLYDPGRTIIRGYCDGRVFDVQLAEALHAIAQGHHGKFSRTRQPLRSKSGRAARYSLDIVTGEVLGREDAKVNDRFRLSYWQFDGVPLDQLPYEARQYPVDDAVNTQEVALAQAGHLPSCNPHDWVSINDGKKTVCYACQVVMSPDAPIDCMIAKPRRNLHDLARQTYAAWALRLGASWGYYVDQSMVDALEAKIRDKLDAESQPFYDAGILRPDGTENQAVLKAHVARAYGATEECPECQGTGKIPSPATEGRTKINCKACDGTKLLLTKHVPRSDGGGVSKNRDALQESGDETLMAYGEQEGKKILTTFIPLMRKGRACNICGKTGVATKYTPAHAEWCSAPNGEAGYRSVPLIPDVNPLVETGRKSAGGGIDSLPRKGGVRECFRARPGYVYSSEDYQAGELVTHAWSCLKLVGYSKLADALNHGLDAHLALAGTMLSLPYEKMIELLAAKDPRAKDNRQAAKAANFGFPGGMAELTFVLRKRADPDLFTPCPGGPDEDEKLGRGYKGMRLCILMGGAELCGVVKILEYKDKPCPPVCKWCVEEAAKLREFWFRQWPENNQKDGYFGIIKRLLMHDGPSRSPEIVHHQSKRIRGGLGFCDGANGLFQGLLADIAKNAFCQVQRECLDRTIRVESSEHMTSKFAGGPSPLLGSRAIDLKHDEIIAEHPESVAPEAATRVSEIMVEAMRFMCPELAPAAKAEPTLMRFLAKEASPVYDANGRLAVWEPKEKAA